MGAIKQAQIEEDERNRMRTQEPGWPRCNRCSEPIEFDLVDLDNEGNIDPFCIPSLCSRCKYMTQ